MVKLPFSLKPFTEDRLLGLKPFATMALHLTTIHQAIIAVIAVPNILMPWVALPVIVFWAGLWLAGLTFFFPPIFVMRDKLIRSKQEALKWVASRYTRILERLKASGDNPLDEGFANELVAVDMIQRDIDRLPSWPFDSGFVARLAAVMLSVITTVVVRAITIILKL